MGSRQTIPARPVVAKIGNYAAPVDTSGMDEDMKHLMTEQTDTVKKASHPKTPMDWLRKILGIH